MFKNLFENCIARNGSSLNCYICNHQIPANTLKAAEQHTKDTSHKLQAEPCTWDKIPSNSKVFKKLVSFSENDYRHLLENGITFKVKIYYCNLCECKLSFTSEHLDGKHHKRLLELSRLQKPKVIRSNNIKKQKSNAEFVKMENMKTVKKDVKPHSSKKPISNDDSSIKKVKGLNDAPTVIPRIFRDNNIKYLREKNVFFCNFCECDFPTKSSVNTHINSFQHKIKIGRITFSHISSKDNSGCLVDGSNYFNCNLCQLKFENEIIVQSHCFIHLVKERKYLDFDIIECKFDRNQKCKDILCLLCGVLLFNDIELAKHVEGHSHRDKLSIFANKNTSVFNNLSQNHSAGKTSNFRNATFVADENIASFIYNASANSNADKFHQTTQKVNCYKCFLCNITFKTAFEMCDHYENEVDHLDKLEQFKKALESGHLIENDSQSNLSDEENDDYFDNHCDYEVDDTNDSTDKQYLDEVEDLEVNNQIKMEETINSKKMPISVPMTEAEIVADIKKRTKSFIARYNRRQRKAMKHNPCFLGNKYVSMCLDLKAKDNIYNSNSAVELNEMIFGASLTFSLNNARICIPCESKFINSMNKLYEHLNCTIHKQNMDAIQESNEESKKFGDQFSHLDLAKSCMAMEKEEIVKCYACKSSVGNTNEDIEAHLNLDCHVEQMTIWKEELKLINERFMINSKDIWYCTDRFQCWLCNYHSDREIRFAEHLNERSHLEKAVKGSVVNDKMNICYSCSTCWFGPSDYNTHYKDPSHYNYLKNYVSDLPNSCKSAENLMNRMDKTVEDLIRDSNKVLSMQQDKERKLMLCMEDTARSVYPHAKAYAFGSRLAFLGFPSSDVDVFLDCENGYNNVGTKEKSRTYIRSLTNNFLGQRYNWKVETILLQARVPIIKLEHKKTGLKCDLSFISGLGVEKSKLIRYHVIAYKRCRELILFLKKWFKQVDLYGPRAINAYAISWYVIFYLQTLEIFPSVDELKQLKNESVLVDGWQCGFLENIPLKPTNKTFKDLLRGFFLFYAKFDYQTQVACPLIGKVVNKQVFANTKDLPQEMSIYKCRLEKDDKLEVFRFDSPMCIQDPVDLSQNITKAVSKIQLRIFRNYCIENYKAIERMV